MQLTLLGFHHRKYDSLLDFTPAEGNFEHAMNSLQNLSPFWISQEIKLFDYWSKPHSRLLISNLAELDGLEDEILRQGSYGEEYEAGMIYARRNNVPLYWIDFGYVTLFKAISTNLLNAKEVNILWDEKKRKSRYEIGTHHAEQYIERNNFMSKALFFLQCKYRCDGVHMGGSNHYYDRSKEFGHFNGKPIQDYLHFYFRLIGGLWEPEIEILDFSKEKNTQFIQE
jgi:hypothetical protein